MFCLTLVLKVAEVCVTCKMKSSNGPCTTQVEGIGGGTLDLSQDCFQNHRKIDVMFFVYVKLAYKSCYNNSIFMAKPSFAISSPSSPFYGIASKTFLKSKKLL